MATRRSTRRVTTVSDLREGHVVGIKRDGKTEKAIVLKIRKVNGAPEFFVHLMHSDHRFDDWFNTESVDLTTVTTNDSLLEQLKKFHEIRQIDCIHIGDKVVRCWYSSLFDNTFLSANLAHVCQFCLDPFCTATELDEHFSKCKNLFDCGTIIYNACNLVIIKCDGAQHEEIARNIHRIGKLFLFCKDRDVDVTGFFFYVLYNKTATGYEFVGFFSKQKNAAHNLSCITVLPCYQKKGYGRFLIHFSYELSRLESEEPETPERPLSEDFGMPAYFSYWNFVVRKAMLETVSELRNINPTATSFVVSVKQIAQKAWMIEKDVQLTLRGKNNKQIFGFKHNDTKVVLNDEKVTKIKLDVSTIHCLDVVIDAIKLEGYSEIKAKENETMPEKTLELVVKQDTKTPDSIEGIFFEDENERPIFGIDMNPLEFTFDIDTDFSNNGMLLLVSPTDVSKNTHYKKVKNGLTEACCKCLETKLIFRSSMCRSCYTSDLKEKHEKDGLPACVKCTEKKEHYARGLCKSCYNALCADGKLSLYPTRSEKSATSDGEPPIKKKKKEKKKQNCVKCQQPKDIKALGKCDQCYQADYREQRKSKASAKKT